MYSGVITVNDEYVASMISDALKIPFFEHQPSRYTINYDERDRVRAPTDNTSTEGFTNTGYILSLLNANNNCEWSWSYVHPASPFEVMTLSKRFNYNGH